MTTQAYKVTLIFEVPSSVDPKAVNASAQRAARAALKQILGEVADSSFETAGQISVEVWLGDETKH